MVSNFEWLCKVQYVKDVYSLPCPLPQWPSSSSPQGQTGGFATGIINIGELEIAMVKKFEYIGCYFPPNFSLSFSGGLAFLKPVSIPNGFHIFGHFSQPTEDQQLATGYCIVVRDARTNTNTNPPLKFPSDYNLEFFCLDYLFVWVPDPPKGYQAMGYVVKTSRGRPGLDEVVCVRNDLVLHYRKVNHDFIPGTTKTNPFFDIKGVNVGQRFRICHPDNRGQQVNVCCLRNLNPNLEAMPNLEQVEALIDHYGPTVYFHPDEVYLPSSVPWFFNNKPQDEKSGSQKDEDFSLDLPQEDDNNDVIKHGNLESAEVYVHVKPALGGTFTDIDMWIFFPYKGPETFTMKLFNINLYNVHKHVGHWEHFTLRLNNFDGQLWSVYFSGHKGKWKWVEVGNLEFTKGTNKPIVYSSKWGHTTFPYAGTYIQGYTKLGIGMKKDVKKSDRFIDASKKYQIISAGYLGGVVAEPFWLQYMKEWGPERVFYDGRSKLEKIISCVPFFIRPLIHRIPPELYNEDRPTRPTTVGMGMEGAKLVYLHSGAEPAIWGSGFKTKISNIYLQS